MASPRRTQLLRTAGRDRTDVEPILSAVSGNTVTTACSAHPRTRASVLVRGQGTGELRPAPFLSEAQGERNCLGPQTPGNGRSVGLHTGSTDSVELEKEAERLRAARTAGQVGVNESRRAKGCPAPAKQ